VVAVGARRASKAPSCYKSIGLGTKIKYLRRTTSTAAGSGLGATIKNLVNQTAMRGQEQVKLLLFP
jgi:hypothetical protein